MICKTSQGGKEYHLVSAKLLDHSTRFFQEKIIELMYINKNGLQRELEKLCSFDSLRPEKVVTRLGKYNSVVTVTPPPFSIVHSIHLSLYAAQLQSEAQKIVYIKASKIEIIEEEGHEGKEVNRLSYHNFVCPF